MFWGFRVISQNALRGIWGDGAPPATMQRDAVDPNSIKTRGLKDCLKKWFFFTVMFFRSLEVGFSPKGV